jgi:hypothetical protein
MQAPSHVATPHKWKKEYINSKSEQEKHNECISLHDTIIGTCMREARACNTSADIKVPLYLDDYRKRLSARLDLCYKIIFRPNYANPYYIFRYDWQNKSKSHLACELQAIVSEHAELRRIRNLKTNELEETISRGINETLYTVLTTECDAVYKFDTYINNYAWVDYPKLFEKVVGDIQMLKQCICSMHFDDGLFVMDIKHPKIQE